MGVPSEVVELIDVSERAILWIEEPTSPLPAKGVKSALMEGAEEVEGVDD